MSYLSGSIMELWKFTKGTHCKIGGEISGEGKELGAGEGRPQCLLNYVIKQNNSNNEINNKKKFK